MKRLIFPALLLLAACESPNSTSGGESTDDVSPAPAAGARYHVGNDTNYYIREWQHPTTGCWYLLGVGDLEGIQPLNDAQGQICGAPPTAPAPVAR